MMRSERGFIGDIVEQVGRAAGIRYQGPERAGSQEDCERQSVRGHLDRKAGASRRTPNGLPMSGVADGSEKASPLKGRATGARHQARDNRSDLRARCQVAVGGVVEADDDL